MCLFDLHNILQNIELIGAYVCATKLVKGSIGGAGVGSIDGPKANSGIVLGILTGQSENCYYIATLAQKQSKKDVSNDESTKSDEGNSNSKKEESPVIRVVRLLKQDTVLHISIPRRQNQVAGKEKPLSITKDTSHLRKRIGKYTEGKCLGDAALVALMPGLQSVLGFEKVVSIYGKLTSQTVANK